MKTFLRITICIILLGIFCSCDPGHGIILQNNSADNVEVRVINSTPYNSKLRSIILIADSLTTSFGHEAISFEVPIDSIDNSRTFELKANRSAMFDYGINHLDTKQRLVINTTDTLTFKEKKRLRKEGTSMRKLYVFSVRTSNN